MHTRSSLGQSAFRFTALVTTVAAIHAGLSGCTDSPSVSSDVSDMNDVFVNPETVADTRADTASDNDTTPETHDDATRNDAIIIDTAIIDTATMDAADTAPDTTPDPVPPAITITVAEVPPAMNGSIDSVIAPLSWQLRVNRAHVTLDVMAAPTSGPITWETLEIACDDGTGDRPMTPIDTVSPRHRRHLVTAQAPLAAAPTVVCHASVAGPFGTTTAAIAFEAADLPPELDPFTTPDTWYITFSRDMFSLEMTTRPDGTATLQSRRREGGNGIRDFDEAFFALGLMSSAHPDSAAAIGRHLERRIAENLNRFYGLDRSDPLAPRLVFLFEGTPAAAPYADWTADECVAAGISIIAVGGDGSPSDQLAGTFGRAWIDWNNQASEDNTIHGLGVFPTALVRAAVAQPLAAILLADFRPDLGGTPFGAIPEDALFIGRDTAPAGLPAVPGVDLDNRAGIYTLLVDFVSLGLASVLAHEIGHSLGLVPFGPPPEGLFAGVAVDFVASIAADAHIDTPGLNIMQTGGSVDIGAVLAGEQPSFEPLSLAYLKRMLVVGPPSTND